MQLDAVLNPLAEPCKIAQGSNGEPTNGQSLRPIEHLPEILRQYRRWPSGNLRCRVIHHFGSIPAMPEERLLGLARMRLNDRIGKRLDGLGRTHGMRDDTTLDR